MRLLHCNLASRLIIVPILAALDSVSTLTSTGGGIGDELENYQEKCKKKEKEKEKDKEKEKKKEKE